MTNVSPTQSLTIAVLGDLHDQWDDRDRQALAALNVDLALFVGDLGNESVGLVTQLAALELPKAVILGNHDAWFTASDWGRKKSPYDHNVEDRVQSQLDILGEIHVGYNCLNLPQFELSIVGARPFSWGGSEWKNKEFLWERYGVSNFSESLDLMLKAIANCTYETVIFLGHNGPYGLGDAPEDPCGKDWQPLGGDHGDPDFQAAIAQSKQLGKQIPLVTFGHMHHTLRHRKDRLRTPVKTAEETVYLNAANVPRIRDMWGEKQHNFSLVTLENKQVSQIELVWVGEGLRIQERTTLWKNTASSISRTC